MRYSVASTRNQPVDLSGKLHLGSFQSSRSKTFMENSGLHRRPWRPPYLAWDNGGASWMLRSQLGPFKSFLAVGSRSANSPNYALASCEKKTVDYMDLVIGGAGIDGCSRRSARPTRPRRSRDRACSASKTAARSRAFHVHALGRQLPHAPRADGRERA